MKGKCPCCEEQIILRDHLGRYSMPKGNYANVYILLEKGDYKAKLRIPCCKDCISEMNPQEVYEFYKDTPACSLYKELELEPVGIEEYKK